MYAIVFMDELYCVLEVVEVVPSVVCWSPAMPFDQVLDGRPASFVQGSPAEQTFDLESDPVGVGFCLDGAWLGGLAAVGIDSWWGRVKLSDRNDWVYAEGRWELQFVSQAADCALDFEGADSLDAGSGSRDVISATRINRP
jgi:hypothetical protein